VRLARAFVAYLAVALIAMAIYLGTVVLNDRAETLRTTSRYDPPVLAGQMVPGGCTGGFYAREGDAIVLTFAADCVVPGTTLRESDGGAIGLAGRPAQLLDCPAGRFCSPSDFLSLVLAPGSIPWGHLNEVDMGAGGYRTIQPGARPLACGDIHIGDRVEVDGREHHRTGTVVATSRYEYSTDTIFPCMVVSDIGAASGDSGGAVFVNGLPAGSTSRSIAGDLAFTPLAEGLDSLGLELCTTPDCDATPVAPSGTNG
jgi:hypothetical protein